MWFRICAVYINHKSVLLGQNINKAAEVEDFTTQVWNGFTIMMSCKTVTAASDDKINNSCFIFFETSFRKINSSVWLVSQAILAVL